MAWGFQHIPNGIIPLSIKTALHGTGGLRGVFAPNRNRTFDRRPRRRPDAAHLLKTTGMQVTAEYAVGPIRINGRPAGVGQGTANRVGIRSILVFTP